MSPSWRDRLSIGFAPRRAVLVRLGKGLSPRVADKAAVPCPEPAEGAPPWQPALDALAQTLADRRWKAGPARVVVSNHFAHYLLIPWQEKLTGEEELQALVRYRFGEVYGDAADGWDVVWSEGRPPAPSLACAVDRRLLAGLREACGAAGLSLQSIQPYLMAAFNRWRRELDGRRDWFLLAEEGRLCLAWFQEDEWAGLHCQGVAEDWGGELPRILERALLLSGRDQAPGRLCIAAPDQPAGDMGRVALAEGWSGSLLRLPAVPGFVPDQDTAYALAMTA